MSDLRTIGAAALLLAGCGGPKPLTLPEALVDRAATCAVVAAAGARLATSDVQSPLPLAAQGKVAHYALLAATEGGPFDPGIASSVSRRTSALQEQVTAGKWQDLAPACASAFPAAERTAFKLPEGRLDAQLACEELADFAATALAAQKVHYRGELAAYGYMRSALNDALAPGLRARAGSSLPAQQRERRKALAAAARLGSPIAVLDACKARFGEEGR
jgi:hypothetical protein